MYQVALDQRALEGQEAGLDLQELKESQAPLVCPEEMGCLVQSGLRGHQVFVVQLDHLENKDQEDCQAQWGPLVQQDHRDHLDNQDFQFMLQDFHLNLCLSRTM